MAKREMRTTVDEQTPVLNENTEVVEPKAEDSTPVYKITGCSKLRVRKKPEANADVVCLIDESNELKITNLENNKDWVRVTTDSGKKGFCMKKFVTIK